MHLMLSSEGMKWSVTGANETTLKSSLLSTERAMLRYSAKFCDALIFLVVVNAVEKTFF